MDDRQQMETDGWNRQMPMDLMEWMDGWSRWMDEVDGWSGWMDGWWMEQKERWNGQTDEQIKDGWNRWTDDAWIDTDAWIHRTQMNQWTDGWITRWQTDRWWTWMNGWQNTFHRIDIQTIEQLDGHRGCSATLWSRKEI
jgi:hypothetical protein